MGSGSGVCMRTYTVTTLSGSDSNSDDGVQGLVPTPSMLSGMLDPAP